MNATPAAGRLIAVTGIDGAGKSTLAAALHDACTAADLPVILVGKRTVTVPANPELSRYLDALNAVVYRRAAAVGSASGDHYWLLALAAWYTLQDQLVIRPALQAGTHVVLDNTHHKILARYAVNPDVPTGLARQVFAHLTPADLVLFLHVAAEEALRRKEHFTPLEAGRSGTTGDDFVTYQQQVTDALLAHADDTWAPINVTSMQPDDVLHDVIDLLDQRQILTLTP